MKTLRGPTQLGIRQKYETERNKREQKLIVDAYVEHRNAIDTHTAHTMYGRITKDYCKYDACLQRNGRIVYIAEVKNRYFEFRGPRMGGGYDCAWLPVEKTIDAMHYANFMKLPCLLLLGFIDGLYVTNIGHHQKIGGTPRIVWGGRSDRGDPRDDDEPMFCFAWDVFTKFRDGGVRA